MQQIRELHEAKRKILTLPFHVPTLTIESLSLSEEKGNPFLIVSLKKFKTFEN